MKNREKSVFPKSITYAAHGLDGVGLGTDLLAQCSDMNVDGPFQDQRIFAEGRVDQLRSFECATGLANECIEQSKLALGQLDGNIVDGDAITAAIERDAGPRHGIAVILLPSCLAAL